MDILYTLIIILIGCFLFNVICDLFLVRDDLGEDSE